jgi:hypothetical protein
MEAEVTVIMWKPRSLKINVTIQEMYCVPCQIVLRDGLLRKHKPVGGTIHEVGCVFVATKAVKLCQFFFKIQ